MADYKGIHVNEAWVASFKNAADFEKGVDADTKKQWAELFGITAADYAPMFAAFKGEEPKADSPKADTGK